MIETIEQVSTFSRTVNNELAKGYYPTDRRDIVRIKNAIEPDFPWKQRTADNRTFAIVDPCAGEGDFLAAVKRAVQDEYRRRQNTINPPHPHEIVTYAVELDQARGERIQGAYQVACGSFFDTTTTGPFNVCLLNPPYHRQDGATLAWIKKAADWLARKGLLVLIVPDYEFHRAEIQEYVSDTFPFVYAFKSENFAQFKQLIIFLGRDRRNRTDFNQKGLSYGYNLPASNFDSRDYPTFSQYFDAGGRFKYRVEGSHSPIKPLIETKDMQPVYQECADLVDKMAMKTLEHTYPQAYDTSIKPLASLRTAHAVQLAAMNSQIEAVSINGTNYLAKYMLTTTPESFKDEDGTETIVHKPMVEAFLMDRKGKAVPARELKLDYMELTGYLSEVLLKKLDRQYRPLHEFMSDPDFLREELEEIGLLTPQREAVKALVKGFHAGYKGLIVRANTGTGKTYIQKALHYLTPRFLEKPDGVSILTTEPGLVEQMAEEYADEKFKVYNIDSWKKLEELVQNRPKGLYLLPYTRLRMHPKYRPATVEHRKMSMNEAGAQIFCKETVCPDCLHPIEEKIKKGTKTKCEFCGGALYSYEDDGIRSPASYKTWIRQIEKGGPIRHRVSSNSQLPYIRLLKKLRPDVTYFDELQNAANLTSNQGAAFIRLASVSCKVVGLTATISNGLAKSFYNILWGMIPERMEADGWNRNSATSFQTRFGAFKEVRKVDNSNRHREGERVSTRDTAGISPAILAYTLPIVVCIDSDDFDDLPPVEREMIKCAPHPEVEKCKASITKIIENADLTPEERFVVTSVRNAAFLRVADTFCHYDDELKLRDIPLGTLKRRSVGNLLEKEEHLVRLVREAIGRGERVLVYTGNTQKIDMRPVLKGLVKRHVPEASVTVLPDSIKPQKVVAWFKQTMEQVVIVPAKRVATGLNLSQFNNLIWYDYTNNTRLAEQGDGRPRRVNTAMIHREIFGEVRLVRYFYLVTGEEQEAQLSYTLEKRMVSKLSEGEIPDIDPAECSFGEQSFSGMLTKALQRGQFSHTDPSVLLKKMTKAENNKVRKENFASEQGAKQAAAQAFQPAPTQQETKREPAVFSGQMGLFDWAA